MATVNEIQAGRYNDLLHKLLSMKEGAPSPTLSPEIVPILDIESDRPEWRFLAGEYLFAALAEVTGVAAQLQRISIVNPAASGVIIVLERLTVRTSGNVSIQWGVGLASAAGAPTVLGLVRETRWGAISSACGLVTNQNSAALAQAQEQLPVLTNDTGLVTRLDYILSPGFALNFVPNAVNTSFGISLTWRQRPFEQSETR